MKNYQPKIKTNRQFAKKSFGQNFLVEQKYIDEIIGALDPQPSDIIIEIGAGRGALTRNLLGREASVLAIEFDQDLIPILKSEFEAEKDLTIISADALKLDFRDVLPSNLTANKKAKVVANLPYNISTAILQRLIEQRACFSELILMLQREVVDRLTAAPGTSERGYLTVLVEAYFDREKLFDVPPQSFRPIPQVWSSVIRLLTRETHLITDSIENEQLFWQLVGVCFAQKRKTILNNLKNAPGGLTEKLTPTQNWSEILQTTQIEQNRRAETLTLAEWILLFKASQAA